MKHKNPIDRAVAFIALWEGCSLYEYRDVAGYPTVGYGHLVDKDTERSLCQYPISRQKALEMLYEDVRERAEQLDGLLEVEVYDNQWVALISLLFNIGYGNFRGSTLLRKLNEGRADEASLEFPKWRRSGGEIVQGLVNRRKDERRLFDGEVV